jgi:hypothetical protein
MMRSFNIATTLSALLLICTAKAADPASTPTGPPVLCADALDAINAKGRLVGATRLRISISLSGDVFGEYLSIDVDCPVP